MGLAALLEYVYEFVRDAATYTLIIYELAYPINALLCRIYTKAIHFECATLLHMLVLLFFVFCLDIDVELLMIDFCVVDNIYWLVELTFLSCSRPFLRKRYSFLLAIN